MRRVLFLFGLGAWLAIVQPAFANDVSLDQVTVSGDDVSLAIPHIVFTGANIDAGEARALFDPQATADQRKAILGKLTAQKITAPSLTYGFKGGSIALSDFEADHVAAGKAAHVALSGGALRQTDARGEIDVTLRASSADDLDLSRLLAATGRRVRAGDVRAARVVSSGFSALFTPTGDADLERIGALAIDLQKLETETQYKGDDLVRGSSAFDHLTLTPVAGSAAAAELKAFGYSSIDLSGDSHATYDPDKQIYSLKSLRVQGVGLADAVLSGVVAGLSPADLEAGLPTASAILSGGELENFSIHLVDKGLLGHVVDFYANRQDASPEQMRRQWAAAASLMIPILMKGDPASLVIAQALSAFIRTSGSLDLSLKAKADPVSFADLLKAVGSGGVSSQVEIEAQATHK